MQDDGKRVRRGRVIVAGGDRPEPPLRTTSQALLGTGRELIIEHDGREYHLRLTQQGKLILTA